MGLLRERCPKCGASLTLRKGSAPFYGCTEYPTCAGTRGIDDRTGLPDLSAKEMDLAIIQHIRQISGFNDRR